MRILFLIILTLLTPTICLANLYHEVKPQFTFYFDGKNYLIPNSIQILGEGRNDTIERLEESIASVFLENSRNLNYCLRYVDYSPLPGSIFYIKLGTNQEFENITADLMETSSNPNQQESQIQLAANCIIRQISGMQAPAVTKPFYFRYRVTSF